MVKIGDTELGEFPILLAPMEDVSDPPFRALCKANGCDMMYSEFISVEGLIRDAGKSRQKLDVTDEERPIGIQIFGALQTSLVEAAKIVEEANPNVIDINFGCPVKKVVSKGAGAAILKDIPKMVQLSKAIVEATNLPVTVKTRLGWDDNSIVIEEVIERLQDVGVQAITVHARTRKQMYKGSADWSWFHKIMSNPRIRIPIFGNGDIKSAQDVLEHKEKYGVDGIMIGRAAIGNPWIFREVKQFLQTGVLPPPPTIDERVAAVKQHIAHSMRWKGERLGVLEMRRHYTNYFKGYEGIKKFRMRLVTEDAPEDIFAILDELADTYRDI